MIGKAFICAACTRFRPFDLSHQRAYCEAFPDGIPDDIIYGGFDHRVPHDGDNGIRFLLDVGQQEVLDAYEDIVGIPAGSTPSA